MLNPSTDFNSIIRSEAQFCAHIAQSTGQLRWVNAANTAQRHLLATRQWSFDGSVLVVRSATNPMLYRVSAGQCQCIAFTKGQPCWHRAAFRIIKRASAYAHWLRNAEPLAERVDSAPFKKAS